MANVDERGETSSDQAPAAVRLEGTAPNQGATGSAPAGVAPTSAGPRPSAGDEPQINQGATGDSPRGEQGAGESPLSVATDRDQFAERPEVYAGAAFAGGFLLARVLKWLGPS